MTATKTSPKRFFVAVELSLLQKLCPNWEQFFRKEDRDLVLPEPVELIRKADETLELKVYE